MRRFSGGLAAIVILALLQPAFLQRASAEVFFLRSGGRLEGDLVNADQKPRTTYVIGLAGGGRITLDADVVEKVQAVRPELAEYEKMRRQAPDTVEGQLKMSDWCRDHNLTAQRKTHLERVVQLDTDNLDARRLLGYRKIKDKWMTHEEEMADKGLVQSRSPTTGLEEWITPQEKENRDSQQKQIKSEAEWRAKIRVFRSWLDGNKSEQGASGLRSISDPMAIEPLAERLNGARSNIRRDPSDQARLIYVEVLARFDMPQARGPLATCSIDDPVEEVRLSCLDELEKQKDPALGEYFVRRMSEKKASDDTIDRAGVALGRIKDPSTVSALVKYVEYERTELVPTGNGGGPGSMTTTFNKNGGPGGGLSMNQKPKTIQRHVNCRGVLDALIAITGQNFGYDSRAWQTWYRNQVAKGLPIEAKK